MPGPAPKPSDQRRRRNAPLANTTKLPAEGRPGKAPPWPLGGKPPSVWATLWATPQASAWERLGYTRIVARYARLLALADDPEATTPPILTETRQLEDRLGLSPMAMLRLRWEIAPDEVAEKRQERSAPSRRRTLKVVGDAVAGP